MLVHASFLDTPGTFWAADPTPHAHLLEGPQGGEGQGCRGQSAERLPKAACPIRLTISERGATVGGNPGLSPSIGVGALDRPDGGDISDPADCVTCAPFMNDIATLQLVSCQTKAPTFKQCFRF